MLDGTASLRYIHIRKRFQHVFFQTPSVLSVRLIHICNSGRRARDGRIICLSHQFSFVLNCICDWTLNDSRAMILLHQAVADLPPIMPLTLSINTSPASQYPMGCNWLIVMLAKKIGTMSTKHLAFTSFHLIPINFKRNRKSIFSLALNTISCSGCA